MKKEDLWKLHSSINDWIKVADSKALFIITVLSVVIAFLGIIFSRSDIVFVQNQFTLTALISLIGYALISILTSISVLFPVLKTKYNLNKSILFYMDIASFNSEEEYTSAIKTDENIDDELISQIFINSKIAKRKFVPLQWAMAFIGFSIIALLVFVIFSI